MNRFRQAAEGLRQRFGQQPAPSVELPNTLAGPNGMAVLVIDDDPKFLEMIKLLLSEAGYEVLTSMTGPKGLDMLRYTQDRVRAVLLDFNMPAFDGSRTIFHLRKLVPEMKVIGVTGLPADELPADFRAGVDALMLKPFPIADLLASLQTLTLTASPATPHR
jgi:CheY-like chemotaxis protein